MFLSSLTDGKDSPGCSGVQHSFIAYIGDHSCQPGYIRRLRVSLKCLRDGSFRDRLPALKSQRRDAANQMGHSFIFVPRDDPLATPAWLWVKSWAVNFFT